MNLDELRSVRRTERQKDSLQHLRDSFYADAAGYVEELKERRERAAEEADDPFSAPEVGRLTDEIETAEEVVEAIYERRVGKVVKQASFAAADMPTDDEGLTREERRLFQDLVDRIKENRGTVLDMLAGEVSPEAVEGAPPADAIDDPTGERSAAADESSGSPAALEGESTGDAESSAGGAEDVLGTAMGGGDATDDPADDPAPSIGQSDRVEPEPPSSPPADRDRAESGATPEADDAASQPGDATGDEPTAAPATADTTPAAVGAGDADDRATLRITEDVGRILGVDEREYDLASEDVVTLPETNAAPLVERDAAERLD